ncbi:hypothetical protein BASA62_009879 [Batrachochytrium salamandrivorans]|nr:hypothetical protein BASA62_009879 [Batrachochytrium salamandrivorans]
MHAKAQHRVGINAHVFYTIPRGQNQAIKGSTNSHDQHAAFEPSTPHPPHGEDQVGYEQSFATHARRDPAPRGNICTRVLHRSRGPPALGARLAGFGRPGHFCASPPEAGSRSICRNQASKGSTNSHDQHAASAPSTPHPALRQHAASRARSGPGAAPRHGGRSAASGGCQARSWSAAGRGGGVRGAQERAPRGELGVLLPCLLPPPRGVPGAPGVPALLPLLLSPPGRSLASLRLGVYELTECKSPLCERGVCGQPRMVGVRVSTCPARRERGAGLPSAWAQEWGEGCGARTLAVGQGQAPPPVGAHLPAQGRSVRLGGIFVPSPPMSLHYATEQSADR